MSRDVSWPEVTRKRRLTGSQLEVAVEGRKLPYTVHFTSYKAVDRRRRQSRVTKWCHVTSGDRKWRYLTGSQLKMALEGRKLLYTVHYTSYKAVAQRMPWRDRRWRCPQMTGSELDVTSFNQKSHESGCRGPKTGITVHFTSYKVVARKRRPSRDRRLRHTTSGDRKWSKSDVWLKITWKWL